MIKRFPAFALLATTLACGDPTRESTVVDQESDVNQQALSTSWTGPWGDDSTTYSSAPAASGKYSGTWFYAIASGGGSVAMTLKYTDSSSTLGNVTTAITGRLSVAPTKDPNGCELLAHRDSSTGKLVWALEQYVSGFALCSYINTSPYSSAVADTIDTSPAIASYVDGSDQVYWAFAGRASDGALLYGTYFGSDPNPGNGTGYWTGMAAKTDGALKGGSSPAAVSWGTNRVDIFVRGTDDNLYWRNITYSCLPFPNPCGFVWSSWTGLGAPSGGVASDPAVASKGANKLDVCVLRGSDGNVACRSYNSGWDTGFRDCGAPTGGTNSAPTVTTNSTGSETQVFVRNSSNKFYGRTCN